jgi:hypothetical protein
MKVVNLTPHEVTVFDDDDVVIKTYPSEGLARARQTNVIVGCLDGTPVVKAEFGEVDGLPAPTEGTVFIVSFITVNAAKAHGRTTDDLLVTSSPVRNDKGQVIGCRAFARV